MTFALAASLLLSAAPPGAAPTMATPEAAVRVIFAPYATDPAQASPVASWERPIYARQTLALIHAWQRSAPDNEVDDLSDGDWLCQCQDWDARGFKVTVLARRTMAAGLVELRLDVAIGSGERRKERMALRREAGQWRIDDLFADGFRQGLKRALSKTTAADHLIRAKR